MYVSLLLTSFRRARKRCFLTQYLEKGFYPGLAVQNRLSAGGDYFFNVFIKGPFPIFRPAFHSRRATYVRYYWLYR